MARIKFSALISSIKGSVGSGTFQGYVGGYMLRSKPLPLRNPTADQLTARKYVAQVQSAWSALTEDERSQWSSFRSFVPSFQRKSKNVELTGFNLFLKYNLIRLHAGFEILTSFSFTSLDAKSFTPRFIVDGPQVNLVLGATIDDDEDWILFKVTPVFATASFSKKSKLRVLPVEPIQSVASETFQIDDWYEGKFGYAPDTGDQVVMEITRFSTVAPIIESPILYTNVVTI
jgi:hypothetical protein